MTPGECVTFLRDSRAFRSKRDIGRIAACVERAPFAVDHWRERGERIRIGDDTAAIPDGAGYLLLAAEGILPDLLERDPYFAGWCSVMVNVSDVAAMGGFPLALVDVYFHVPSSAVEAVAAGIRDACRAYGVPLVGGHTTRTESGPHALAVAILGRAERLLTSFGAKPGDAILACVDLRGGYHGDFPFWDATTGRSPEALRDDLALLSALAEREVVRACKDVSNVGIVGTVLMMLEASGAGAVVHIDRLPRPAGVDLRRWLLTFPSYGFVFAASPDRAPTAVGLARERGLACEVVGAVDASSRLHVAVAGHEALLWDLAVQPLTGFDSRASS
jgi:AIR synthase-related protein